MSKNLYEKHNYLNKDIKFIKDSIIVEYDMKNAGLSILRSKGLIDEDTFNSLMNDYEKLNRDIIIGKWIKENPDISIELMNGFVEAREEFFRLNDIKDSEVLSIKKDAIFLINKTPSITQINEYCLFRKKNTYNMYMNIRNKEFYYNADNDELTIKGIKSEIVKSQTNYLFKFIKECFNLVNLNKNDDLFIKCLEFKNDFIERELDSEYYKDIDLNSFLLTNEKRDIVLTLDNIGDVKNYNNLSITNNLTFIIEIISKLLS